jgi:hypothetical protein
LLDRISATGYHATLREVQALISYLLFGGQPCAALIQRAGDRDLQCTNLVFTGEGPLFEALRATADPSKISHPVWDELLINGLAPPEDWLAEWYPEHNALDYSSHEQFRARKRAFYFCNTHGDAILKLRSGDAGDFQALLRLGERDLLRTIIKRINAYFGATETSDSIRVWTGHRYNQSPRRMLYSTCARSRNEFEAVCPKPAGAMASTFDLAEDHVLVRLKKEPHTSLRVDYDLFVLLKQTDSGVPVLAIENDATRRLWQFMEQLTPNSDSTLDEIKLVLHDPASGHRLHVEIDVPGRRYLQIRSED